MKATRHAKKQSRRMHAAELPLDLAPHPRAREMARKPQGRAAHMSEAQIRATLWQAHRHVVIPETAIHANVDLQNAAMVPRPLYVDMLKTCRTCSRPFLFYAQEQRFWFETLRIPIATDCQDCAPCRKQRHRVKACLYRYEKALHAPRLDAKDMKTFVDDTLFLFEQGLLRNVARVGAIKNRALRELGACSGAQRLAHAIALAREAAEMRPGAFGHRHWAA